MQRTASRHLLSLSSLPTPLLWSSLRNNSSKRTFINHHHSSLLIPIHNNTADTSFKTMSSTSINNPTSPSPTINNNADVDSGDGATITTTTQAVPEGHQLITEGQIKMLYPKIENSVFYNPVQVQNRDLSVLMLGMYAERRTERLWIAKKRKEVRKDMMHVQKEEAEKNKDGKKKTTKEERKARLSKFEHDLEARVAHEKSSVNFTKLTNESSSNNTTNTNNNDNNDDGLSIFEALAASGLRSLRYWKEVPGVRTIVVNDLDPVAVDMARENIMRNGMAADLVTKDVEINTDAIMDDDSNKDKKTKCNLRSPGLHLQVGDATHEMYISRLSPQLYTHQCNPTQLQYQKPQYDIIDLDPYGSAAPFLDAAMQSVVNGGLLAVTCTDMAALGGSHPETCYGRYGAFPIQRSGYLQELALRILLYHMSVIAGRYGRTIKPVLSVGMAFYCRVFVEVYDDKAGVNNLSLNHGHLFQSIRCSTFHVTPIATNALVAAQQKEAQQQESNNVSDEKKEEGGSKKKPSNVYRNGRGPCDLGEPVCGETGAPYKLGGPIWTGPLHDMEVVNDAITRLESAKANDGINPSGGSPMHPLHTANTLHGLLVSVSEELNDVPLYHLLPSLCSSVNSQTIPMTTFKAALANAGYRASAYHKEPQAVKTDAPNHVVWDIVRAWCKEHPPHPRKESKKHRKGETQAQGTSNDDADKPPPQQQPPVDVAAKILANEMRTKVDFTIPKGFGEGRKKATRWARNPEANWGPKKAASGLNKTKKRKQEEEKEADGGEPNAKQGKTEDGVSS